MGWPSFTQGLKAYQGSECLRPGGRLNAFVGGFECEWGCGALFDVIPEDPDIGHAEFDACSVTREFDSTRGGVIG
jgi:hypothetical protein